MRHYNRSSRTSLFAQNFLWIGYQAWQGYLNCDRGIVAISSQIDLFDDAEDPWGDSLDPSLNFRYIPQAQLGIYLQEWLIPSQAIEDISSAVSSYQPSIDLIFAIESDGNLDIGWCQHLKILPPDCHQQICRRWSEFQVGSRE